MLRIVALPDVVSWRAAMVAHMASKDESLASAALEFQYGEIRTADDARPHVAGIVAALSAPHRDGRWAAMYSFHGLTPPEALDRLVDVIARAIRRPKKRHATRPTGGSRRRRLDSKRRHGEKKRLRGGGFE